MKIYRLYYYDSGNEDQFGRTLDYFTSKEKAKSDPRYKSGLKREEVKSPIELKKEWDKLPYNKMKYEQKINVDQYLGLYYQFFSARQSYFDIEEINVKE